MGFSNLSDRYASLDANKDPLIETNVVVPWDEFWALLERIWLNPAVAKKPREGRKPMDLVLISGHSFMRFLWLGLGDRVPDGKTVGLYRDALGKAVMIDELFPQLDGYMARWGYIARGGQILDASIVRVPHNHNKRTENVAIKAGETPLGRADEPAKRS